MSNFIVADRKTDYLLPPSVDDWLNEDHLARYIVEVVDQLDLSRLTRQYAGRGSKAHHPATLLSILIYGYCSGVFSSRKPHPLAGPGRSDHAGAPTASGVRSACASTSDAHRMPRFGQSARSVSSPPEVIPQRSSEPASASTSSRT